MRRKKRERILLVIVLILIFLGVLILASASASFAQERTGNPFYFLKHQIFFGLIPGIILMLIFSKISLSFLKKMAIPLLILNILICSLALLPKTGVEFSGATRWVALGPIALQPAEFLKIFLLIYLAAWLTKKGSEKETLFGFLVILLPITLILTFQPDISTLGIIITSSFIIYFLSNTPFWHTFLIIGIGVLGFFFLTQTAPYRIIRLKTFLEPRLDPLGGGYQIGQALIAIGSGAIFGKGLGLSGQKLGLLPGSFSDSIFAIFAEETGFFGSFILILLFLIFLVRGFKISKKTKDKFSQILALGISSQIALQALVNIGAMTGILPLTGIPLPFISYGGSHLISELIGVGILLNISSKS